MGVSDSQLKQAWSTLDIKSIDASQRIIEGIASTPTPDEGGDVMEPAGAQFQLPIALLWNHKQDQPIGEVVEARVTPHGIFVKAQIAKVSKAGRLQERLNEVWDMIQAKLVRGLSIGWKPIEAVPSKSGGLHALKWRWLELSTVVIPMNREASILSVKSCDLAASGTGSRVASTSRVQGSQKRTAMNISEQISEHQAELRTKSERLTDLIEREDTEGGLSAEEATERDTLTSGVESLTTKIKRLQTLELAQAAQARNILHTPPPEQGIIAPKYRPKFETVELEKGTKFVRYAMAVAAGKGSLSDTLAYAKRWDAQTPEVSAYIKAIAGTASGSSPVWGTELVYQNNLASEFVELMRPMTIIGRITGLRNVPFNVRIPTQTGGSTVNWVGEQAVKPVTELDFGTVTLPYDKIAGIVVLTEELVRLSTPSAEATVRRDLTEQIAQFMDEQFLDPTITATDNRPASITNGVASPAASGDDADALYTDLNTALATFDNANLGTESVHIIMPPALARGISTMRNALGQSEFPLMNPQGGTLMGYPVIVSANAPDGTIVLVKANEILIADDGRVTLDASNQATLDMAGGSSPTFSLWQKNCIGIRAERWVTWKPRRSSAVAVIDTASYGPSAGSPG